MSRVDAGVDTGIDAEPEIDLGDDQREEESPTNGSKT